MKQTQHVTETYFHAHQPNYQKIIISWNNLFNVTIQSHPIKDGWPNEKCWIVATINPISHSHPVHHGRFFNVLIDKFCSCKHREIIIFVHNYFKNKHKQSNTLSCISIKYIFLFIEIRYFILLAINTHIDCAINSKFSVRCILKATARSLESVSFCIFCCII